jgi:hypothetical protein
MPATKSRRGVHAKDPDWNGRPPRAGPVLRRSRVTAHQADARRRRRDYFPLTNQAPQSALASHARVKATERHMQCENALALVIPDDQLGGLLAALSEEGQRIAGAARAGIMAEFAAAMQHARRYARRGELPAIMRALKDARRAALAAARGRAALELQGRREAVLTARPTRSPRCRQQVPDQ